MRLLTLVMAALVCVAVAPGTHAQDCSGTFPTVTLDPNAATTVIPGGPLPALFGTMAASPENPDSNVILYVGDASTLDGCIGGLRSGDPGPTGILVFNRVDIGCFAFDVETSLPYHLAIYDLTGAQTRSTTEAPGRLTLVDYTFPPLVHRIVISPGESSSQRVPLCIDNWDFLIAGSPVAPATWGGVKILYR